MSNHLVSKRWIKYVNVITATIHDLESRCPSWTIQNVRVGHGSRKMVLYPVHNLQIWLLEQSKEKGGNRNA